MIFSEIKYVYLLGIGGIGMSALARYFKAQGKVVSGYDKTSTSLTDSMISEGISIHFDDDVEIAKSQISNLKSQILIIYTPAIPKDHSEFNYFKNNNYTLKKRSEVLGEITKQSFTIAVAGTHGKTTTSALITHILSSSGIDCTAFVGGIMTNYNTNIIISPPPTLPISRGDANAQAKYNEDKKVLPFVKDLPAGQAGLGWAGIFVVEADEYDRSFLTLHPDIAVITSMDADHLDIYGEKKELEKSFNLFAQQVQENGVLIHKKNLPLEKIQRETFTYSINEKADFFAKNILIEKGKFVFETEKIKNITLGIPGKHNVENALAAIAVAQKLGIQEEKIKNALQTFKGVKRRFEYIINTEKLIFIDDYAHHPEELSACISTAKELYPERKITGIFQPHLFTRTRDFANEFARSLELLDELILLPIYPARELPLEGVNSEMLLRKIKLKNKILCQKSELISEILKIKIEVLLTLGAGDIDTLISPISLALQSIKSLR